MASDGVEFTATAVAVRRRNFEWSVGGSVYTNASKVKSLGGAPAFSLGNMGWIMEGQPIPVIRTDACVTNPDATGAQAGLPVITPTISTDGAKDCVYGPNLPPHTYGVHSSLTGPRGITLSLRGEYEGGHYMYDGAGCNAVTRSVR